MPIHIHTPIQIHSHMHAYIPIHMNACTHTHIHTHRRADTHRHTHMLNFALTNTFFSMTISCPLHSHRKLKCEASVSGVREVSTYIAFR